MHPIKIVAASQNELTGEKNLTGYRRLSLVQTRGFSEVKVWQCGQRETDTPPPKKKRERETFRAKDGLWNSDLVLPRDQVTRYGQKQIKPKGSTESKDTNIEVQRAVGFP